jgi:DNA-binding MarR family transcriptional regulator
MVLLRREGIDGRQPSEIAASSGVSKQSVNDGLRELEALGYVRRTPHPHDGRARIMRLTARGRRLDEAIQGTGKQVESKWRDHVGAKAWDSFVEVLNEMAEGVHPPSV